MVNLNFTPPWAHIASTSEPWQFFELWVATVMAGILKAFRQKTGSGVQLSRSNSVPDGMMRPWVLNFKWRTLLFPDHFDILPGAVCQNEMIILKLHWCGKRNTLACGQATFVVCRFMSMSILSRVKKAVFENRCEHPVRYSKFNMTPSESQSCLDEVYLYGYQNYTDPTYVKIEPRATEVLALGGLKKNQKHNHVSTRLKNFQTHISEIHRNSRHVNCD